LNAGVVKAGRHIFLALVGGRRTSPGADHLAAVELEAFGDALRFQDVEMQGRRSFGEADTPFGGAVVDSRFWLVRPVASARVCHSDQAEERYREENRGPGTRFFSQFRVNFS
jgi:hypothetical protein